MERRALLLVLAIGLATAVWFTLQKKASFVDPLAIEQIDVLNGHLLERPFEDFALQDLHGNPISLQSLRGNVIFLNFWASWCAPCLEEMPSMARLAERMDGKPFRILAVSLDDEEVALDGFLAQTQLETSRMTILRDPGGLISRNWGTQLLPETWVIDREGRLIARFMGARDWHSEPAIRLFEVLTRPQ